MSRAPIKMVEASLFLALAALIHLAFFWTQDGMTGQVSGGSGGASSITMTGASAAMAERIAEWEAVPDVVDPPSAIAPDLPVDAPMDQIITMSQAAEPVQAADAPPLHSPATVTPQASPPDAPEVAVAPAPAPTDIPRAGLAIPTPSETTVPEPGTPPPPQSLPPDAPPAPAIATAEVTPPEEVIPETPAASPRSAPMPRAKPKPPARPRVARAEPAKKAPEQPTPPVRTARPDPAQVKTPPEPSSGADAESTQPSVAAGTGGGTEEGDGNAGETAGTEPSGGAELAQIWGSRIRREVERKKAMPRTLRRSGAVLVAMTVERDGRLMSAKIQKSSGSKGLDAAAMKAVEAAAPYVPAPAELTGTMFQFVLPVVFRR
ncbi:MAG: TonB family protein [Pseudomonadota bacterium]